MDMSEIVYDTGHDPLYSHVSIPVSLCPTGIPITGIYYYIYTYSAHDYSAACVRNITHYHDELYCLIIYFTSL